MERRHGPHHVAQKSSRTTWPLHDASVFGSVPSHVPSPSAFVATLAGLVKPGGVLVLSTLNRTARSYALAIVGAEYVLGWLPRGTHDWTRFVTPDELQGYCRDAGLGSFSSEGVVYDLIADQWRRAPDTGVNYMAAAVRPV